MELLQNTIKRKLSNSTKFLIGVIFIYLIIAPFNFTATKDAFLYFLSMLLKIIPLLAFVFIIMIGVNLYLTEDKIKKHIGESAGIKGWIYAMIAGILISGPPYVLYPLLGDLKKHGMKNSLIAVLLYNRNVKIQFIPAMIYYFGLKFTIIISIYIIIFSILNGLLIEKMTS